MPWHIDEANAGCDGFAVVKDATGEVVGCHRTRDQALRQLAALHIAESEARAGTGPKAILVDIDGTLTSGGRVNQSLIDYLNGRDEIKIVVTARNESQRDSTTRFLDSIGLEYRGLHMNPGGDSVTYKRDVTQRIMRTHDVILAVDNNPDVRAMYQDLGIETITPFGRRQIAEEILASLELR